MTLPHYGNGCELTNGVLKLSKIGVRRTVQHRPLEGTPKTRTICRVSMSKWSVTIACVVDALPLPAIRKAVGIDIGLL
jgi:putative transposase